MQGNETAACVAKELQEATPDSGTDVLIER